MEKIKDIYWIPAAGIDSNIYVIGNILVDAGTGRNEEYIFSQLKTEGISPSDIEMIVNTHCHYDHVGGNCLFPDAKVAIHEIDAVPLREEGHPLTVSSMFGDIIQRHDTDIELKEGDKIADFKVLHTPGHTKGGICLYDGETLISGDTVFSHGGFGRTDIGGDLNDMKNSISRLNELEVEYLLPGHGPCVNQGNRHLFMSYSQF